MILEANSISKYIILMFDEPYTYNSGRIFTKELRASRLKENVSFVVKDIPETGVNED